MDGSRIRPQVQLSCEMDRRVALAAVDHAASAFRSKSISRSHGRSWFQLGTVRDQETCPRHRPGGEGKADAEGRISLLLFSRTTRKIVRGFFEAFSRRSVCLLWLSELLLKFTQAAVDAPHLGDDLPVLDEL